MTASLPTTTTDNQPTTTKTSTRVPPAAQPCELLLAGSRVPGPDMNNGDGEDRRPRRNRDRDTGTTTTGSVDNKDEGTMAPTQHPLPLPRATARMGDCGCQRRRGRQRPLPHHRPKAHGHGDPGMRTPCPRANEGWQGKGQWGATRRGGNTLPTTAVEGRFFSSCFQLLTSSFQGFSDLSDLKPRKLQHHRYEPCS